MTWWKVLIHNKTPREKHESLQSAFAAILESSGGEGYDVGLFGAIEGDQHAYYFSPAAAKLAANLISRYSGVPCAAPKESAVTSLVAWGKPNSTIPFDSSN